MGGPHIMFIITLVTIVVAVNLREHALECGGDQVWGDLTLCLLLP